MPLLRYSFTFVFLGFSILFFGQTTITVVDVDGVPMTYVDVYTEDYDFTGITDSLGQITIPKEIHPTEQIIFGFVGYKSKTYKLEELISNPVVVMNRGVIIEEVVLVGRTDNRAREGTSYIESIDAKEFSISNPQTSADALGMHAGVFIQKSQGGGGSPVVRGFEANKVLLVLDGVRLNNAIYRSGHLQNSITIDPAILQRLEVLYGAGSLMYGSDAIGGVIHFRTKNPKLNFDKEKTFRSEANAYVRFATANAEKTAHVDYNIGGKVWASLSSVSYSDFGDTKAGANRPEKYPDFGKRKFYVSTIDGRDTLLVNEDPNVQVGTAYSQMDFFQKFLFQPSELFKTTLNIQYSQSSDIPRYDQLIEPKGNGLKFSEWYYGPQRRLLISLRNELRKETFFYDKIFTILSYQKIGEDRINRKIGSFYRNIRQERLGIWSATVDIEKEIGRQDITINYGAEYNRNNLSSMAMSKHFLTGEPGENIFSRYPSGGGHKETLASYFLLKRNKEKWGINTGLRLNYSQLSVKYEKSDPIEWTPEYISGLTNKNTSFSWAFGIYYKSKGWKIMGQLSSAFRSPNIDDIAKIRVKGGEVTVPNPKLKPETSLNGEVNISKEISQRAKLHVTGFVTSLRDAIVRGDFSLPKGSSVLIDSGDTLQVVANVNAAKALVRGVSLNGYFRFSPKISTKFSLSYIRGWQIKSGEKKSPLPHIPPLYGRWEVNYDGKLQQLKVNIRFNGKKPLDQYGGSADNLEYATPEGSLPWWTLNMYYQRILTGSLSFSLGIENIFDLHYRPFSSGVSAPGRNFLLRIAVGL